MIKIEIFETADIKTLKNVINTYLEDHPSFKIIDIKYIVCPTGNNPLCSVQYIYSALIMYQRKGQEKTYSELGKEESRQDIQINRKYE